MLKHSQAKSIAEGCWGRGGTRSYGTNRPGAFYFTTSSHGGFVIDADCLSEEEKKRLDAYVTPEQCTIYTWERYGKKHAKIMHPYRIRSFKTPMSAKRETKYVYLLEEDCDWCLVALFTKIRVKGHNNNGLMDDARKTFDVWFKP